MRNIQFRSILNGDDFVVGQDEHGYAIEQVVFPDAVPPVIRVQVFFSIAYQKYAAISEFSVLKVIRSLIVIGSALNLLIEKVLPCLVTSLAYVS